MKYFSFILLILFVGFLPYKTIAQKKTKNIFFDATVFYGIALEHDKKLAEGIQGNPYGLILSYNLKNTKVKEWLTYYNHPDFGFSALYQNTNSSVLGEMYGLYPHYNFYLNNRNAINKLQLRIAFGLGYITMPYHYKTNQDNFAIGSKFAGSSYLRLNYQREFFKNKLGLDAGIALIHFSNAGFKSPNLGLNTIVATIGLNYNLQDETYIFPKSEKTPKIKGNLDYSFSFKTGINESKNINSSSFPFYVGSFMISKQINYKSSLTLGADYFVSNFLTNYIDEDEPDPTNTNKNRFGLVVGHELKIDKVYAISEIGYYVYYPKKYVSRIYERFGFKYYLNNTIFTQLSIKVNLFRAETLEFGIGFKI